MGLRTISYELFKEAAMRYNSFYDYEGGLLNSLKRFNLLSVLKVEPHGVNRLKKFVNFN